MGDFKMDGYEALDDKTFYMSVEMSNKRTEILKFYMELAFKFPERFNEDQFAEAFGYLNMGTMLMEKALFVKEDKPTGG